MSWPVIALLAVPVIILGALLVFFVGGVIRAVTDRHESLASRLIVMLRAASRESDRVLRGANDTAVAQERLISEISCFQVLAVLLAIFDGLAGTDDLQEVRRIFMGRVVRDAKSGRLPGLTVQALEARLSVYADTMDEDSELGTRRLGLLFAEACELKEDDPLVEALGVAVFGVLYRNAREQIEASRHKASAVA